METQRGIGRELGGNYLAAIAVAEFFPNQFYMPLDRPIVQRIINFRKNVVPEFFLGRILAFRKVPIVGDFDDCVPTTLPGIWLAQLLPFAEVDPSVEIIARQADANECSACQRFSALGDEELIGRPTPFGDIGKEVLAFSKSVWPKQHIVDNVLTVCLSQDPI